MAKGGSYALFKGEQVTRPNPYPLEKFCEELVNDPLLPDAQSSAPGYVYKRERRERITPALMEWR